MMMIVKGLTMWRSWKRVPMNTIIGRRAKRVRVPNAQWRTHDL